MNPPPRSPGDPDDPDRTLPPPGDAGFPTVPATPPEEMETSRVEETVITGAPGAPSGSAPSGAAAGGTKTVFAGRFEVMRVLGEGGMGKVFQVHDRQIEGREVALKILRPRFSRNPRFRELFFQEIRAAQNFVSEHVIQVRDTGQMEDGKLFLTMDFVEGEDLSQLLRREDKVTARHALEIGRQMLLGLQSGHEQGFVHRDVKPQNVMLAARVPRTEENPFGIGVRLLDFGIAGLAAELEEGNVAGTPMYMSPEQVQGQRLDARSDLFAVGVCLYEMISGEHLFHGTTLQEIQTSVIETDVQPLIERLDDLPGPVQKILRKALRKDRAKRFQSAAEFIEAIETSKAYKEAKGTPAWVSAAFVLVSGVAIAEAGFLYFQLQKTAESADVKRAEIADAVHRKEQELGKAHRAEVFGLEQELDSLRGQVTLMDKDLRDEDLVGKARDYDNLKPRYDALEQEHQRLKDDLDEMSSRLTALESENRTFQALAKPPARSARCFDGVLERIKLDAGDKALAFLDSQMVEENVFPTANADGRELVMALAQTADSFKSARVAIASGGPGRAQLETARAQLAVARSHQSAFPVEASAWIDFSLEDTEPPDRVAALAEVLDRLESDIQSTVSTTDSQRERLWQDIASGPPDQDPTAVIQFVETYGRQLLPGFLERLDEHLKATATSGGQLDFRELADTGAVRPWGEYLFGPGRGVAGDAADSLRLFYVALLWYEGGDLPSLGSFTLPRPDVTSDDPTYDWRSQLSLQVEIASGASYPPPAKRTAVYHNLLASSSSPQYLRDVVDSSQDGVGSFVWKVGRRIYDEKGDQLGNPLTYEITRQGDSFFVGSELLLDLRANGPAVRVASWSELPVDGLPQRSWSRALPFDQFQDRLDGEAVPCLVFDSGGHSVWVAPGYGLVREERAGTFTRQLVFTNSVF